MSTESAADALAARTADLGLRLAELPVTFDIDEERDLEHLRARWPPMARAPRRPGRHCGDWGWMAQQPTLIPWMRIFE